MGWREVAAQAAQYVTRRCRPAAKNRYAAVRRVGGIVAAGLGRDATGQPDVTTACVVRVANIIVLPPPRIARPNISAGGGTPVDQV